MKKRLSVWESSGGLFIAVFRKSLHFSFEVSNFWTPVAMIAAVNESAREHLKMVFWPACQIFFGRLFEKKDLLGGT